MNTREYKQMVQMIHIITQCDCFKDAGLIANRAMSALKLDKIIRLYDDNSNDEGYCYFCNSRTSGHHIIEKEFYVCRDCACKHYLFELQKLPYTVNLTYFKLSGKYYSSGSYETYKSNILDIHEECLNKLQNGDWPGMCGGSHDMNVLINIENHPMDFPRLFMSSNLV